MLRYLVLLGMFISLSAYSCDFPSGFPAELLPPECSNPQSVENSTRSTIITPEVFDRQWQAGNKSRLIQLQSARLNPYSDEYLEKVFSLDLNKSIENFDIETSADGEQSAEITGSHLYWYGENFFFDAGSYRLDYTITNLDYPDGEEEKNVGYTRTLLGARFNPVWDLSVTFGLSINRKPEVVDGLFSSDDVKSTDPFFAISGLGFHYSRDQNDEIKSDYTSYSYQYNNYDLSAYWLRASSKEFDVEDEFGTAIIYHWDNEGSLLRNTLKISRNELKNTSSEYWGADLEYGRFTLQGLLFDSEGDTRKTKYGYGLSVNISDFMASENKAAQLSRSTGFELGVHYNNISEYVLTAEDAVVWSLIFHGHYGK